MNYFEIITILTSLFLFFLAFKVNNPLNLFHIAVVANVLPFFMMDYQGSNQLRFYGMPLSMLPHFVLLSAILLRYNKKIKIQPIKISIFFILFGLNIFNMSFRGHASLVDYFFLLGFVLVVFSIPLLKRILDQLQADKLKDFIRLNIKTSIILILAVLYSYFVGSDAQRGNPAVIMNRNLFSILLILNFHFNVLAVHMAERNIILLHIINTLILICIVLLGSRAAILAILVYLIIQSKIFRLGTLLMLPLIFIISRDFLDLNWNIIQRFSELVFIISEFYQHGSSGLESIKRVSLLFTALNVLQDHWVIGIGAGTNLYKHIAIEYSLSGYVASPHNLWLSLFISFGVFQTLLLIVFLLSNFRSNASASISATDRALLFSFLVVWCFNQYFMVPLIVVAFALIGLQSKIKSGV